MKTPVLVVGGGPVGLAMAGDLGWRGVACVLIEKTDGVVTQPKMDLLNVRTMELARRWGLVAEVESAGYNRDYTQDCAWVTSLCGYELGREPFPPCSEAPYPPESPQRRERCPQNFFDPVLARFVRSFPHVTARTHAELVEFAEHAGGVTATVLDRRSGKRETIEADTMIACDGGGSMIRDRLGIALTGNPVLTYTTNIVFRCDGLERLHHTRPAYRYIFIAPEGTWATLVAIDGRDHWRFSHVGDKSSHPRTVAEWRREIERAVGREFDFEILSVMPWTRRELVAERFGTKRIFLAGDAAHQLSPTGAFGMNTGLQEAADLSWKLEARLAGWGGARLLASYEIERKPVAARNAKEAAANLRRMLAPRSERPPAEMFEPGPAGDRARKTFGDAFTQTMRREWFTLGIQLGYRYENSPICIADGTPPPPDSASKYLPTARPGHRAPHVWLGYGRSTLDLFGRGFALLRFGPEPPDTRALEEAAAARAVPLTVTDVADEAAQALYGRRLVLVRPDGHVAWRADRAPEDAGEVMDTVRGA